jgi:peptidoglycan/LPS O-acetylase OafA/YrhL
MDRWLIVACALFVGAALLTIAASTLQLMGHYDAKLFVVVGGVLSLLLVLATDGKRRNGR